MRFYRRRYAPKSDARIVVLVFVVVVSAIQYAVRVRQHSVAIKYFKTYDKKFKIRVKQLAAERFEEQQVQAKGKLSKAICGIIGNQFIKPKTELKQEKK